MVPFDCGDPAISLRLKLECEQETGSFKARGATNQLALLSAEERERGTPWYGYRFERPQKQLFVHDARLGWAGRPGVVGDFASLDFATNGATSLFISLGI